MATSGILISTQLTPMTSHMVITSPPRESDALQSQACIALIISYGVEPLPPRLQSGCQSRLVPSAIFKSHTQVSMGQTLGPIQQQAAHII